MDLRLPFKMTFISSNISIKYRIENISMPYRFRNNILCIKRSKRSHAFDIACC